MIALALTAALTASMALQASAPPPSTPSAPDPVTAARQAHAQQPGDPARPSSGIFFSPTGAVRYGVEHGCLPAVVSGLPARRFFVPSVFSRGPAEGPGRHQITSSLTLEEDARGACTLVSERGKAPELRSALLATLADMGVTDVVRQDSGPGSRDVNGDFRQELHCLAIDGKALFLVMSTSTARNRRPLMASFGRDTDGACQTR